MLRTLIRGALVAVAGVLAAGAAHAQGPTLDVPGAVRPSEIDPGNLRNQIPNTAIRRDLPQLRFPEDSFTCPERLQLAIEGGATQDGWSLGESRQLVTDPAVPEIGHDGALVCRYGRQLTMQRPAPSDRPECAAAIVNLYDGQEARFICTERTPIHRQESKFVAQTSTIDLDTGQVGGGLGAGADLWFNAASADPTYGKYWEPVNGAKIDRQGGNALVRPQCKDLLQPDHAGQTISSNTLPPYQLRILDERNYEQHYCVLTSEGRLADVYFLSVRGPSNAQEALIQYTVWASE